jgi:DNA-binding SARP family transcriptional activator
MSVLRIFLLGSAAFFWNDQPVNIRRRIQRALLIYLAMHPEGVLRDDLALLFWQAGSDERKNLREALSKLRAELPAENLIETDRERVRLRQELVYVDALDFLLIDNQTVRIVRQTPSNLPLPDAVCQQMNKAVSLWRSPHFLAGSHLLDNEEIIDWLRSQSSLLETKRMDMLEHLASHYSASGDPVAALHPMKLSLEMDELNPDMQWRYLSSLVSLDRRSEARNQASHMCALFKRENIELPARLEKLCEQLHQLTNSHLEYIPLWLPSIVTQVPFVGRDGELKALLQAYPRGGMVVIHGEAGAGKTRLIYV